MSTKKEREIEYLSSLGLNVIDGETTIKYANGELTKDGFLRDDVFYDTKRGMCHWVDDRMSIKTEDLNYFLDLIIESKYLSDGLLWGIALSTWPVISRQLHEAKLSTPIVFFVGEPGTLKTSIARMFLTTGRYKKKLFGIYEIPAFMSAAKFKKEIQDVKSSLILMDDLHEVTSYGSKDKMQGNIDTICRDFYDYRNDSSLVITTESSVNLKFTESFLQRVVWVNFSNEINKEIEEKERYFEYMEFRSDDVLRILTEYQVFLLKQIYLGHITSGLINQRRKTVRKESLKDHNKTERQSDKQAIFEFSMSLFREFCSKFDVSEKRLNSLFQEIQNTKKRTLSGFNFYAMTLEQKIYHCLKLIGSKGSFLVNKPKEGEMCINFELDEYDEDEFCQNIQTHINSNNTLEITSSQYLSENESEYEKDKTDILWYRDNRSDDCDYGCFEYKCIEKTCYLSIQSHKYCVNKDMKKLYWSTSFYLDESLKRRAVLIEDHKKIPFISELYPDEHYSLLIVSVKSFIKAMRDLYDDECKKYRMESIYLTKYQILDTLNKLGIIGYIKTRRYTKDGNPYLGKIYEFDFPTEKAYILKIPDEIYEAINSNIEKQGFYGYEHVKEKNKERAIFDKISQENDQKLYDIFYNFDEINFL